MRMKKKAAKKEKIVLVLKAVKNLKKKPFLNLKQKKKKLSLKVKKKSKKMENLRKNN